MPPPPPLMLPTMTVTSAAAVAPAPTLLSLLISDWLHDMRVSLSLLRARACACSIISILFQKNPFFKFLPQKNERPFSSNVREPLKGQHPNVDLFILNSPPCCLPACLPACLLPGSLLPAESPPPKKKKFYAPHPLPLTSAPQ